MNIKKAADNLGLDESEYIEIVQLFVKVSNEDLQTLKSAIEAKNASLVFETSHSIKGAAINLGFQEIAEIAKKMESNARRNCLDGSNRNYNLLKCQIKSLASRI